MAPTPSPVQLIYEVPASDERWVLEDAEDMPETPLHEAIIDLLRHILRAWVEREGRDAMVGCNIALRWDPSRPRVGVDPDVYVVEPAPPGGEAIRSLLTWKPGHNPPRLAVEVVSEHEPEKDYGEGPEKYAASGTRELWVFDPLLLGPAMRGGPHVLQIWRRDARGRFRRVYAGEGPGFSRELRAWVVVTDGGRRVRVADDAAGRRLWRTLAESERAEKERERAEKERERAEKERERAEKERAQVARAEAEAEVTRLRAEVARLRRRAKR